MRSHRQVLLPKVPKQFIKNSSYILLRGGYVRSVCPAVTLLNGNVRALARVLDRLGFEYQIVSETQADVFGTVNVTQLTLALAEEGCEVASMQERDESLESYYVNLVGGARRE